MELKKTKEIVEKIKDTHTSTKVGSSLLLSTAVLGTGAIIQNAAPNTFGATVVSADSVINQLHPGESVGDSSNLISDTSAADLTDSEQWTYESISTEATAKKDNGNTVAQAHASEQGQTHSNYHSALHGAATTTSGSDTNESDQSVSTAQEASPNTDMTSPTISESNGTTVWADEGDENVSFQEDVVGIDAGGTTINASPKTGENTVNTETTRVTENLPEFNSAPCNSEEVTVSVTSDSSMSNLAVSNTYNGSQSGIGVGGGGLDNKLSPVDAGLASWNSSWSETYGKYKISGNSAVTTSDGTVTSNNFQEVLNQANVSVNNVSYTQFVTHPMLVNGVQYAGYLTDSSGNTGSDFLIAVQNTSGFSVYNLGANFVFITPILSQMQTRPDDETSVSEDAPSSSFIKNVDDMERTEETTTSTSITYSVNNTEALPKLVDNALILTEKNSQQRTQASYHSVLDMSLPFKFGTHLHGLTPSNGNNENYLGLRFLPSQKSLFETPFGDSRGIGGLPNATFAGWLSEDNQSYIEIITTDENGILGNTASRDTGINPKTAVQVSSNQANAFTVSWSPILQTDDTGVTGTLVITLNGKTVTYANLTLPQQACFGIVSSQNMGASLFIDFSQSSFIAYKKAVPIMVYYIDQSTGRELGHPTIINGKHGQWFTISSEKNRGDTDHYNLPVFQGYKVIKGQNHRIQVSSNVSENEVKIYYKGEPRVQTLMYHLPSGETYQATTESITGVDFPEVPISQIIGYKSLVDGTVSALFPSETANEDPVHSVAYQAVEQEVRFTFDYDKTIDTTPAVPEVIVQKGEAGHAISLPNVQLPSGYFISSVTTSLGEKFTGSNALKKAIASMPTFGNDQSSEFKITFSASYQEAHLTITQPDGSKNYQFTSGSTGETFTFNNLIPKIIDASGKVYHAVVSSQNGVQTPLNGTQFSDQYDNTQNFGNVDQDVQEYHLTYVLSPEDSILASNFEDAVNNDDINKNIDSPSDSEPFHLPTMGEGVMPLAEVTSPGKIEISEGDILPTDVTIPHSYNGTQSGIGIGGGGANESLDATAAGLANWNTAWVATYDAHKISGNSAVTTSDSNITSHNFQAVLNQANICVDGVPYTQFVAHPIRVNGVQYSGYLTDQSGNVGADFLIVVQKTSDFSNYNLGANFAYIKLDLPEEAGSGKAISGNNDVSLSSLPDVSSTATTNSTNDADEDEKVSEEALINSESEITVTDELNLEEGDSDGREISSLISGNEVLSSPQEGEHFPNLLGKVKTSESSTDALHSDDEKEKLSALGAEEDLGRDNKMTLSTSEKPLYSEKGDVAERNLPAEYITQEEDLKNTVLFNPGGEQHILPETGDKLENTAVLGGMLSLGAAGLLAGLKRKKDENEDRE